MDVRFPSCILPAAEGMADGDCDQTGMRSYCMSGFSDALDWRPLLFQEAVVAQSACSLCGVVSRKAVKLSCAHAFCWDCHQDCVNQGNACPLDQESFNEDDVVQLSVSDGYLAKRRVACWNTFSGCSFVGPISSLLDHYKKCNFHVVPCPRCSSSVLRSEIVAHCKNDCRVLPTEKAPPCSRTGLDYDHIEKASSDLKQAMLKMSDDLMFLQTSLNQCCEDVREGERKSKEHLEAQSLTLIELAGSVTDTMKACTADCKSHITNQLCVQGEKLRTATERVIQNVRRYCGPEALHWYIEGWASMKPRALKRPLKVESPAQYACGYKVSLLIQLYKEGQQLRFGCFLEIHPGDNDAKLDWPFCRTFTLGVLHPTNNRMVISCEEDASKAEETLAFQRPRDKPNRGYGNGFLATAGELEEGRFIHDDTLHLFLRLEP